MGGEWHLLDVNMHDFSDLLTDKLNRAYENVKVFIKNIDGGTINKDFRNEYLNLHVCWMVRVIVMKPISLYLYV